MQHISRLKRFGGSMMRSIRAMVLNLLRQLNELALAFCDEIRAFLWRCQFARIANEERVIRIS